MSTTIHTNRLLRVSEDELSTDDIAEWLRDLRNSPYVPDSGFDATSVFRCSYTDQTGKTLYYYFGGANIEYPSHRLASHGEEGSLAAMMAALGPYAEADQIWIMGAPHSLNKESKDPLASTLNSCCGKCRQQIYEYAKEDADVFAITLDGTDISHTTVADFLPDAFGFRNYDPNVIKLREQYGNITPPADAETLLANIVRTPDEPLTPDQIQAWIKDIEGAAFATGRSKVIIARLDNGAYVAGVNVDNAAFVDMSAAQGAMANAFAAFGHMPQWKVTEIWAHSEAKSYDPNKPVPDEPQMLPLASSDAEILSEFVDSKLVALTPVHLLDRRGNQVDTNLLQAPQLALMMNHRTESANIIQKFQDVLNSGVQALYDAARQFFPDRVILSDTTRPEQGRGTTGATLTTDT